MSRSKDTICICFSLVFTALAIWRLSEYALWRAFIPTAFQAVCFALLKRRTLVTFGISHIPALILFYMFLPEHSLNAIWIATFLFILIIVGYRFAKVNVRPKTDWWLGSLILVEVLVLACLMTFLA